MAVNLYPFVRNTAGEKPFICPGKVQAGATQAIKRGEICTWDETSGYFIPVTAVADGTLYRLAIANEEQKSDDLERYIEFIAPRPDDVFEYTLDAARQVALGDRFTLTAADSQKITYTAAGFPIFYAVQQYNYPEKGTTLLSTAKAEVMMNPTCSIYAHLIGLGGPVYADYTVTASLTLKYEQSGMRFFVATDALVITLPAGKKGIRYTFINSGADGANIITISPNAADAIHYVTATDNKDLINTKATAINGDMVTIEADASGDWWVMAIKGTWAKEA